MHKCKLRLTSKIETEIEIEIEFENRLLMDASGPQSKICILSALKITF